MAEQVWIPHKLYSMGKNKPCLRSNKATKSGEKNIGFGSPSRLVVRVSRSTVTPSVFVLATAQLCQEKGLKSGANT